MTNTEKTKIIDLIDQVELCNFKDQLGHKLELNEAYLEMVRLVKHSFKPIKDDSDFCEICGRNFRNITIHNCRTY